MIEFSAWKRSKPFSDDREWLILGKGPTFERRSEFDLSRFVTISLNHVVRELKVDIAHILDFDVATECADALLENARWVVMPRHPHVAFRPAISSLSELVRYVPALAQLEAEGRLVQYDLEAGPQEPAEGSIGVHFFSSEAALDIAGHLGAKRVRTLGVDGGGAYASSFSSLAATTRLANGQPSFSVQFKELERVARRHGLEISPLIAPKRIFVGVQERELIAARVLEFSIYSHASEPVHVVHLPTVERQPKDPKNQQRTPFSFSRFLIPELSSYEGRALYVDSDMQVFDDITKLWDIPLDGATVMCTNQSYIPEQWRDNPGFHPGRQMSVMMLDCGSLDWKIDEFIDRMDEGKLDYEGLLFHLAVVPEDQVQDRLPEGWNHLEHYTEGETKLLHYTAIPTQPWKSEENPLRGIWEKAFAAAWAAGYIDRALVEEHVAKGHVRRSLLDLEPPQGAAPTQFASALEQELYLTRQKLAELEAGTARARLEATARQAAQAGRRTAQTASRRLKESPLPGALRSAARRLK